MAQPRVIKNYNLFVAGQGHAGLVVEATLPKLTLVTEEHRAGGMDAPTDMDMGMEKLVFSFKLAELSPLVQAQFGLNNQNGVRLTLRASQTSNLGGEESYVIKATGMVTEIDPGSLVAGSKNEMSVTMTLNYYKLEQAGNTIHEIDVYNMIRIINGVDQLAARRANIGV